MDVAESQRLSHCLTQRERERENNFIKNIDQKITEQWLLFDAARAQCML